MKVYTHRQEYQSELPFPSPGNFPDPGIKPGPLALQADSEPPAKPIFINIYIQYVEGFPGVLVVKEPACNTGGLSCGSDGKVSAYNAGDPGSRDIRDVGSIPGSGRSTGGGQSNPLWCPCLENPMDRGTWWATVHRVTVGHD